MKMSAVFKILTFIVSFVLGYLLGEFVEDTGHAIIIMVVAGLISLTASLSILFEVKGN